MTHPTPNPARHRRVGRTTQALTATVTAATFLLAGCGGADADLASADSGAAQSNDRGQDTGGQNGAMDAFRDCLAENGVDMGQPPAGNDGGQPSFDQEAMQQAQQACADLMPEGGPGGARGGFDPEAQQEWVACLEEQGLQVETPAGDGPPAGGFPGGEAPTGDPGSRPETPPSGEQPDPAAMLGLDSSDPTVAAAMTACEDLQPSFGGPPSATPETSSPDESS